MPDNTHHPEGFDERFMFFMEPSGCFLQEAE
jgi:hypothetical protein